MWLGYAGLASRVLRLRNREFIPGPIHGPYRHKLPQKWQSKFEGTRHNSEELWGYLVESENEER